MLLRIDPDPVGGIRRVPGRAPVQAPTPAASACPLPSYRRQDTRSRVFTGVDRLSQALCRRTGPKVLADQCTQLPAVRSSRSYEADVELAALPGAGDGVGDKGVRQQRHCAPRRSPGVATVSRKTASSMAST